MKKTARVIVTLKCNRNCPGCCNTNLPEYREVHTDEELLDYEEIVITGRRADVDSRQGTGVYQSNVGQRV